MGGYRPLWVNAGQNWVSDARVLIFPEGLGSGLDAKREKRMFLRVSWVAIIGRVIIMAAILIRLLRVLVTLLVTTYAPRSKDLRSICPGNLATLRPSSPESCRIKLAAASTKRHTFQPQALNPEPVGQVLG